MSSRESTSFVISKENNSQWGFYTSPDASKGTGHKLGEAALLYAFETLNIHKVSGEVLGFNKASIDFHIRLGFTKEATLRDQFFNGVEYDSIICFGLLRSEKAKLTKEGYE